MFKFNIYCFQKNLIQIYKSLKVKQKNMQKKKIKQKMNLKSLKNLQNPILTKLLKIKIKLK